MLVVFAGSFFGLTLPHEIVRILGLWNVVSVNLFIHLKCYWILVLPLLSNNTNWIDQSTYGPIHFSTFIMYSEGFYGVVQISGSSPCYNLPRFGKQKLLKLLLFNIRGYFHFQCACVHVWKVAFTSTLPRQLQAFLHISLNVDTKKLFLLIWRRFPLRTAPVRGKTKTTFAWKCLLLLQPDLEIHKPAALVLANVLLLDVGGSLCCVGEMFF